MAYGRQPGGHDGGVERRHEQRDRHDRKDRPLAYDRGDRLNGRAHHLTDVVAGARPAPPTRARHTYRDVTAMDPSEQSFFQIVPPRRTYLSCITGRRLRSAP